MRTIVIGDIHGCYKELQSLLKDIDVTPDDEVISCGDLVEKGPDSRSVVDQFLQNDNYFSVAGNHDESMVRFWGHEVKKEISGKQNPMKSHQNRIETFESLSDDHLHYLKSLPMFLERTIAGRHFLILHGGLLPGVPPENMDPKVICRLRYLKEQNGKWKMVRAGRETPEDKFWAELYDGSFGYCFYGHQPYDGEVKHWKHACGLDTGAVYGYWLSACIIDHDSGKTTFHAVPCEKYAEPWSGD